MCIDLQMFDCFRVSVAGFRRECMCVRMVYMSKGFLGHGRRRGGRGGGMLMAII